MTRCCHLILLLSFALLKVYSQRQLFEGDVCKVTEDGNNHICKKIPDCPSAFDSIRSDKRPQICGYTGVVPIICCKPEENEPSQPTPTATLAPPSQNDNRTPQNGFKTISEQKCDEYKKYVYEKETNNNLAFTFEEDDEAPPIKKLKNTCGIVEQPLIVNGTPVAPREFPHQVNLGYRYGSVIKWLCTGSLISENFVLSAAHCSRTNYGPPKIAVVGDLDIGSETDNAKPEQINIIQVFDHPNYQTDKPYHDIALYRLQKNVTFDGYKRPACLNTNPDIKEKQAIASGWGDIKSGGTSSNHLLKVRLDLIPKDTCNQYWFTGGSLKRGIDHDQMICAGDLKGKKDTCQGDSGGPLQNILLNPYCMYSIIGVTSFGRSCGIQVPAVYTRVSYFVPWIESIVWPN